MRQKNKCIALWLTKNSTERHRQKNYQIFVGSRTKIRRRIGMGLNVIPFCEFNYSNSSAFSILQHLWLFDSFSLFAPLFRCDSHSLYLSFLASSNAYSKSSLFLSIFALFRCCEFWVFSLPLFPHSLHLDCSPLSLGITPSLSATPSQSNRK